MNADLKHEYIYEQSRGNHTVMIVAEDISKDLN